MIELATAPASTAPASTAPATSAPTGAATTATATSDRAGAVTAAPVSPPPAPAIPLPGGGVVDLDSASAFLEAAGLHLARLTPEEVLGWIDLGPEHHQPWGIVHGGVYATAVESAASLGASVYAAELGMLAVGVNNNTNFVRSLHAGRVDVRACPLQRGRTQQLWEVRITDADGRLIATGQVRLANIAPPDSAAPTAAAPSAAGAGA